MQKNYYSNSKSVYIWTAICVFLSILAQNTALAEEKVCDWKTIQAVNGGYLYQIECHIEVGRNIKEIENLNLAIEMKNEVIEIHKTRADLWKQTAEDTMNKLKSVDTLSSFEKVGYFAAGFLFSSLSVYLATQYK